MSNPNWGKSVWQRAGELSRGRSPTVGIIFIGLGTFCLYGAVTEFGDGVEIILALGIYLIVLGWKDIRR